MPLPIAHGLLGASIIGALHPQPEKSRFAPFFIGAVLANAADFDFIFVFLFHSKAWHRGFTHSIFFALVVCLSFIWFLGARRLREALAYGLAYASHGVLDYVTSKEGGGVELLFPFSTERFILGFVGLSEVPSRLPAVGVLKALLLELVIFTPVLLSVLLLKRYMANNANATNAVRSPGEG